MATEALRIVMVHHYGHVRELATVMLDQKYLEQQLVEIRADFAAGGYPANLQMPLSVRVMWFTKSGAKDLLNLMWTCRRLATSVLTNTSSQLLMHCLTPTHLPFPWEWDAFASQFAETVGEINGMLETGPEFGCFDRSMTFDCGVKEEINDIRFELRTQHNVKVKLRVRLWNIFFEVVDA